MDLVNIQMYHNAVRKTWLFLSRWQGCSNYHKDIQAFLCMGIISLHSKQSLIHFKTWACMDFVNIQMYHHEGRKAWPFSFQMAGLLKLWHGKVSVSGDWALFQLDIAKNLWYVYFKLAPWTERAYNCIIMLWGKLAFPFYREKGRLSSPNYFTQYLTFQSLFQSLVHYFFASSHNICTKLTQIFFKLAAWTDWISYWRE